MKIITILVLISAIVVHAGNDFCPIYCTCRLAGASGRNAFCTQLNTKEQRFVKDVEHLVVSNNENKTLSLSDHIFLKLGLQKLESIEIVNSSLTEISVKAFQGLPSLYDVDLSDNLLILIHADTFANNTNLHKLKLSGNRMQLTQVLQLQHEYLLRSPSLTEFDLSNCQLSQIQPKTFSQLKNLRLLTLSSNYLKTIPKDVFDGLEYLEDLDLSNNLITKVDKNAFKNNKALLVLNLRMNPIEALSGISNPNLEELDLGHCKLHILMKESIEGMTGLTSLNLSSNQIEVISDDSFTDMYDLKHLDLSNNKIIGPLPADLFKSNRDLVSLSLSGNKDLGSFVEDSGFVDLHMSLSVLEIAECGLTKLTNGQLHGMDNLNTLNVSNNMIRELEDSTFASLRHLIKLDLSNNLLVSLSTKLFESNPELEKLWLDGNPIKFLPLDAFSHTPNLHFLSAKNCDLERVWVTQKHNGSPKILTRLQDLDLSDNRLKFLHISDFEDMESLQTINLRNNRLDCVKSTIQLIEWFVTKQVDPYRYTEKIVPIETIETEKLKWNELIGSICPVKAMNHVQPSIKTDNSVEPRKLSNKDPLPPPSLLNTRNSFTSVDEIVVETDSSIMWPMVLAVSILIVALYFIIYLVGEITHRRRALAATYARAGSLGGHVRTRGASGSPLYYKLYEECSIPTQPTKTKKNYVLDFSPIHTILKKNTYKIMRTNNEANV